MLPVGEVNERSQLRHVVVDGVEDRAAKDRVEGVPYVGGYIHPRGVLVLQRRDSRGHQLSPAGDRDTELYRLGHLAQMPTEGANDGTCKETPP